MYNGDVDEAQHTHKLSKIERCAGNGHGLLAYDGVFSAIAEGINVNTPRKKGEKKWLTIFTRSDVFGDGATFGVAP